MINFLQEIEDNNCNNYHIDVKSLPSQFKSPPPPPPSRILVEGKEPPSPKK